MRWVVFILLLLGTLSSLSPFAPAPAGKAGLLWPIAADSKPIISLAGWLPEQYVPIVTLFLAGVAGLFFLVAAAGLFWEGVPTRWWRALVIVAVATSLLLYFSYFQVQMIGSILVDVILLWGVLTNRWTAGVTRMRRLQNSSADIHPLMHIPVPWVYVLAFLAGVGLQYLVPLSVDSAEMLLIGRIAGLVLIIAGVPLALVSLGIFRAVHTTTVPFETASKLVTWGPYRLTRNPMYVGLLLIYLGVAGLQSQIWPLLLLPLLLMYIDRVVIPVEETRLRQVFGDMYDQYCARVHRWVWLG